MRDKRLIAGLLFVLTLGIIAMAWPLTGYPSLWHWVRDMPTQSESKSAPKFDRAPMMAELEAAGLALGNEVHLRIYKADMALEVWMRDAPGTPFRLFKTFDICTFSGRAGPKLQEGDHQAPEGFYRVGIPQLNPDSSRYLSFNLGFPNQYDRSLGRTGSELMIHGGCSSVGCYAMTDAGIDQIYTMVEAALRAGQGEVDVHIFPFRMTGETMAQQSASPWEGYWQNLKEGFDLFEANHVPPAVGTCHGRYVFGDALDDPACAPITGWRV